MCEDLPRAPVGVPQLKGLEVGIGVASQEFSAHAHGAIWVVLQVDDEHEVALWIFSDVPESHDVILEVPAEVDLGVQLERGFEAGEEAGDDLSEEPMPIWRLGHHTFTHGCDAVCYQVGRVASVFLDGAFDQFYPVLDREKQVLTSERAVGLHWSTSVPTA